MENIMGMFDSFYINGKEIQTKELDNTLSVFQLGSVVPSKQNSLGQLEQSFYIIEDDYGEEFKSYYGIVVINNIFVDYVVSTEDEITTDTELIFNFHKKRPQYTASRLTDIIKDNLEPRNKSACQLLKEVNAALYYYNHFLIDQYGKNLFLTQPVFEKFKAGSTLYDVLNDLDISAFLNEK